METLFEIVKYLGKFHPLVLHLPIGSLLMTFLLVVISKLQKSSLDKAIRIGVDFSFFGALTATILGYFLSLISLKYPFISGLGVPSTWHHFKLV